MHSDKINLVYAIKDNNMPIYSDIGTMNPKRFILTVINLSPIHMRLGEGNGRSKRPTPYIATAKKWRTKLKGRGFNPESKETGPSENKPPRLR